MYTTEKPAQPCPLSHKALNAVCLAATAALMIIAVGCSAPQGTTQLARSLQTERELIDESTQMLLNSCNALEGVPLEACKAKALEWQRTQYTLAYESYFAALDEYWIEARQDQ